MRHMIWLSVLSLYAVIASGQATFDPNIDPHVEPIPPIVGEPLSLWASLPSPQNPVCGWIFATPNVSVSGSAVQVTYSAVPPTVQGPCFPEPPPTILEVSIGTLAIGNYTATVLGNYAGVPNPPIVFTFAVLPTPIPAIEYYLAREDHYFITADAVEINALDNGQFPGWVRTGQSFNVFGPMDLQSDVGPSPVCRFYGLPQAGLDSHFYSASPQECQEVIDRFPNAWILESSNVFMAYLPNATDGSCPGNTVSVYRLYDNRLDVDHRYTTLLSIRDQMLNAGWIAEGYGANAVAMCAPM